MSADKDFSLLLKKTIYFFFYKRGQKSTKKITLYQPINSSHSDIDGKIQTYIFVKCE